MRRWYVPRITKLAYVPTLALLIAHFARRYCEHWERSRWFWPSRAGFNRAAQ